MKYKAPWEGEDLSYRFSEILSGNGERIAFVYGVPDTSTFRYRVYNMIEALRSKPDSGLNVSWFSVSEIHAMRAFLPTISTIVLARVRISREVSDLIAAARALGVRVLMDCDDLVFDVRYAQLVSVTNNQNFGLDAHLDSWYAYVGRLNATARLCEGGITTNRYLADKMEEVCGGPVSVIPNFLNRQQEELSRILLSIKEKRGFRGNGRIMIGYFSGSPTHTNDFGVASDALVQLLDEDENIDLRIVGFMDEQFQLARFGRRVEILPLQDWLNLQVKIAEVDINIAPLQQNDFTNCKSELKFFEAAVVGSYTIATRTHTFERAIGDFESGMVIENSMWLSALRSAVDLVRDPERYAPLALRTASRVYGRYGWNQRIEEIISAIKNSQKN